MRPVLVRSNSINVASVLRSSGNPSLSSEQGNDEQDLLVGGSTPIEIEDEKDDTTRRTAHHRRRRSLNVASLFRSQNRGDFLGLVTTPTCVVVDNATIQQHVHIKMPHADSTSSDASILDEEMGLGNLDQDESHATLAEVQFDVPLQQQYNETDSDYDSDEQVVLRHRPVTFGAYHENHNNEMIPELVQAEGMDHNGDEKQAERQHYHIHWVIFHLRKNIVKASPATQVAFTVMACLLTYAVINREPRLDGQIATMVLVTLCGATWPHLITAVACGVYAGSVSPETVAGRYGWVVLLGVVTAFAWQIVSCFGILLGFSGRLGATAFLAMNIVALVVFSFDPNVSFSRYGSRSSLWEEMLSLEEWVVSLLACIFLAWSGGYFRLTSAIPVNPVLVPSAWALFCMLVTSISEYRFTSSVLQGFAVGAYVAMASEARVPSTAHFSIVGLIAGMYNIFLTPFFLGFGGKAGFTAMLGYSTFLLCKKVYKKRIKTVIKACARQKEVFNSDSGELQRVGDP